MKINFKQTFKKVPYIITYNNIPIPIKDKLLFILRPYAYDDDVILDDIYGNTGDDVVIEWRGRYEEDVPIMGYIIPEDRQTEMFALLGEGLWFDTEGTAKQVNNIELAQSDEINVAGVWYRLDYAAGTGKREVYFYDTSILTNEDIAVIAAWFRSEVVPSSAKMFPIRTDRTSKPPIGTPLRSDGHWSVQGLEWGVVFNEQAGRFAFDIVKTKNLVRQTNARWHPSGILNESSTPHGFISAVGVDPYPNATTIIFADVKLIGTTYVISKIGNGKISVLNNNSIRYQYVTTINYPIVTVAAPSSLSFTSIASVANGLAAPHLYVDGAFMATGYAGSGDINADASISIGCLNEYNPACLYPIIAALYFSTRLSSDQIASLSANPWQIYEPETIWVKI